MNEKEYRQIVINVISIEYIVHFNHIRTKIDYKQYMGIRLIKTLSLKLLLIFSGLLKLEIVESHIDVFI